MEYFLNKENEYFVKLKNWYGNFLKNYGIGILYVDKEHLGETEIARIFRIGNKIEISIDYNESLNYHAWN